MVVVDPNPHFEKFYNNNRAKFPHIKSEEFIVAPGRCFVFLRQCFVYTTVSGHLPPDKSPSFPIIFPEQIIAVMNFTFVRRANVMRGLLSGGNKCPR